TNANSYGYDIACDTSGNVYAVGIASGTFNGVSTAGGSDAFLWKISSAGSTLWTKLAGGTSADSAATIDVNAGRIVVGGSFRNTITFDTGFTATSNGNSDAFVWNLDTNGVTQWAVAAGASSTFSGDYVNSLVITATGQVYALGQLTGAADVDPGAGTTSLSAGQFTWKLDADGTFLMGTNRTWLAYRDALKRGPTGDLYVLANISGTTDVDWNPGLSVHNMTDADGNEDYALLRYDTQGQLTGVTQLTNTYYSGSSAVAVDASGNVAYLVVAYNGTIDLNTDGGTQSVSASSNSDLYLVNLQESTVSVSVSGGPIAENGGTATVYFTLNHARNEDVVIYDGVGGTATLSSDYSASAYSVTIPAGQTSGSITFTALNDSTYEPSEAFTVGIKALFGARDPGAPLASITITDDDRYIVSGNTLTLVGTSGDDTFAIIRSGATSFYTYIGGEIRLYDSSVIQNVTTNLGNGTDRIEVYGYSGLTETVTTGDQTLSYVGGGLTINATNAEYIFGFGQAADTAVLNDSIGNDQFYGLNSYAIALLLGRYTQVTSFGNVICNSNIGGYDHGWLFGSTGNDSLAMGYTQSTMTSNSFVTQMNNFEYVYGFAVAGGTDSVTHADSSGDDIMYALTGYTILMAPAGFQESIGFGTTTINSTTGNDQAFFYGSTGNELYDGIATKGRMRGTGFDVSANLAKYNYFYGLGGVDSVDLEDSTGNDVFYGGDNVSTISYGTGRLHQIIGNANYSVHANLGGIDTAVIDDSAGNDYFDSPSAGKLRLTYANARSIAVEYFDAVYARGTAGGTNSRQAGVLSFSGLYYSGTWV
ncbi:MAG: hypothetical protein JNM18_01115, partial [Planctomycetaceae bacterium]|nr:hypothetical protein [Planctomycetaceae bacterium]